MYLSAFYSQMYLLCATDGSVIPGPRLPVRESVKNQIPIPELHTQFLIIFHISKSTPCFSISANWQRCIYTILPQERLPGIITLAQMGECVSHSCPGVYIYSTHSDVSVFEITCMTFLGATIGAKFKEDMQYLVAFKCAELRSMACLLCFSVFNLIQL